MDCINPFDNLHFKQGLKQAEEINSPDKVNEQTTPGQSESQGKSNIPKSNEDDFVDTTALIDDTGNFDTSGFNFEDDNKTGEISSAESKDDSSQNQNNSNKKEAEEQIYEFVNELLEKRN